MDVDFGVVFNALPDAYLLLSADGRFTILAASDLQLEVTRGERGSVVGKDLFDILPVDAENSAGDAIRSLKTSLERVLATGQMETMPAQKYYVARHPDNGGGLEERYWNPVNAPAFGPDGQIAYIIHKLRDITESARRERQNEARLRIATTAAELGSWEFEPSTDLFLRSGFIDDLFGFAPDEAGPYGEAFFGRLIPEDRDTVERQIQNLFDDTMASRARFDFRVLHPDGRIRWVTAVGEVVRDHRTRPAHIIGVMMDVSTEREREIALERALSEREMLLAQKDLLFKEVNHRVKNSLQLVVSILNLQASSTADDRTRAHLESAASRVAAITSIHERLYRTDKLTTVEMNQYLRDLSADIASSASGGGMRWSIDVDVDPVELPIDSAVPLALIVNELVINALKHAYPEGEAGPVRIFLRVEGENLRIGVEDRGTAKRDFGRSGLGSRLIVALTRQIRGKLEKTELDPGYRAELTLPLSRSL